MKLVDKLKSLYEPKKPKSKRKSVAELREEIDAEWDCKNYPPVKLSGYADIHDDTDNVQYTHMDTTGTYNRDTSLTAQTFVPLDDNDGPPGSTKVSG